MFQKEKRHCFLFEKCAFLPNRFEMKSRQTRRCSQRVRLQRVRVLFHRLVFKVSFERRRRPCCVNHTAAWAKKVPEDGIFHNREERLRFPIFDVLRRSSRGRDQCLRSCIKQSSCTENQQKLKKKKKTERTSTFWGKGKKKTTTALRGRFCSKVSTSNLRFCFYHICAHRFSSHMERTCTAPNTASWLAFKMQLWLTEASRSLWNWCKASVWFPTPSTGNLARPLIPSQTPTQCLPSGNTEVKSATQVSPICHKCWRRRQGFEARAVNVVAEVKSLNPKVLC